MAPTSESAAECAPQKIVENNDFKFKCCSKKLTTIVCVSCYSMFHVSCKERLPRGEKIDDNRIICCGKSIKSPGEGHEGHDKNDQKGKNIKTSLELEIAYLKKLVAEMEDKNLILKENNRLLTLAMRGFNTDNDDKVLAMDENEMEDGRATGGAQYSSVVKETKQSRLSNGAKIQRRIRQEDDQKRVNAHAQRLLRSKSSQNEDVNNVICNVDVVQLKNAIEGVGLENDSDKMLKGCVKHTEARASAGTGARDVVRPEDGGDFRVVARRQRKRAEISIGTAETGNNDSDGFAASKRRNGDEKKLWLFLSRVRSNVSEGQVKKYVAEKGELPDDHIVVKMLETKSMADSKCFMLGVPLNMEQQIYQNTFWPAGVGFSRFNFGLGRRFLDQSPTKQKQVPHS